MEVWVSEVKWSSVQLDARCICASWVTGHQSQGHKLFNIDVIQKCLDQGIYLLKYERCTLYISKVTSNVKVYGQMYR